jgi:integrase/recombinase XerD
MSKTQLKDSEYHLKPAEIQKIIYAAHSFRDRCMIKTLAHTALRRAELAALDIRDLDFDRNLLQVREGKGGKSRTVPMSEELASDLKHLIGQRKTGALFLSQRKTGLTVRQVNWIVAHVGQASGVKNPNPNYEYITCHLFRHSFAREWKKRGGSIETLSKILGHTSVKTTLDEYGTETLQDVCDNYAEVMHDLF